MISSKSLIQRDFQYDQRFIWDNMVREYEDEDDDSVRQNLELAISHKYGLVRWLAPLLELCPPRARPPCLAGQDLPYSPATYSLLTLNISYLIESYIITSYHSFSYLIISYHFPKF